MLSRTAFGVTQTKVVDLGPEVIKYNSGYAIGVRGGGHIPYLFLPDELVPKVMTLNLKDDNTIFFYKRSNITFLDKTYGAQLCLNDNTLPDYYINNSFLTEKPVKALL